MKDLVVPEIKRPLSFQSPAARGELEIARFVKSKLVPESERLSVQQVLDQDQEDTQVVEASLQAEERTYYNRIKPIIAQLKNYMPISFDQIYFEKNGQGALAQMKNGKSHLAIDLASLKKPEAHLALIVAHEWAHLTKGHLVGESKHFVTHAKESEADYDAGVFLGAYNYDLVEILRVVLSLPESNDPIHGTVFGRACKITEGYYHGKAQRQEAETLVVETSKLKL